MVRDDPTFTFSEEDGEGPWMDSHITRGLPLLIIPSQMEVALPHRTVDTTQKRILSKNTKETHY